MAATVKLRHLSGNLAGLVGEYPAGIPAEVAVATGFAEVVVEGGPPPEPPAGGAVVTDLLPNHALLGAPDFDVHVIGTGFAAESVILWNGSPEPTTYLSETELTTGVNMATATTPATIPVSVQTGAQVSNTFEFMFLAGPQP